jgi:uncharacterized DUF497 family protein
VEFDWDPAKSAWNERSRGFGFEIAVQIFEGRIVQWVDDRKDYAELRINVVGETDGVLLHVTITVRGDKTRIISARKAKKKEREKWQQSV